MYWSTRQTTLLSCLYYIWSTRPNHSHVRKGSLFLHMSSVRPHFLKSSKTKQSENNARYWRDCGSGWVDHWWHLSSSCCVSNFPMPLPFAYECMQENAREKRPFTTSFNIVVPWACNGFVDAVPPFHRSALFCSFSHFGTKIREKMSLEF